MVMAKSSLMFACRAYMKADFFLLFNKLVPFLLNVGAHMFLLGVTMFYQIDRFGSE